MPRSLRHKKPLSLPQILGAIALPAAQQGQETPNNDETKTRPLQAVRESPNASPFHEALHQYSLFARPKTTEDVSKLARVIRELMHHMATNSDAWKIFTLSIFLRRYHEKAPEARVLANGNKNDDSGGDGERLVFYVTLLSLHRFWEQHRSSQEATHKLQAELAKKTVEVLIRLAGRIGGSRDLCAIIEHFTMAHLLTHGHIHQGPPAVFASKLMPAVQEVALSTGNQQPNVLLQLAVHLAARQLDRDLLLVGNKDREPQQDDDELLSTIHVTLPHNQRGSNTKEAWKRKLTNSLAEILIWQNTSVAKSDDRFARALKKLNSLANDGDHQEGEEANQSPPAKKPKLLTDKDVSTSIAKADAKPESKQEQGHSLIQQMQTSIRKKRQLLNNFSRQQGFLLTSSYQMDKTSLTLQMIRRAKAGDLKLLEKLARKHKDARVLKLIANRHLDPTKATTIADISELSTTWLDIDKDYAGDEIAAIELLLQTNTIQATLDKLRCTVDRPVTVTCVGNDRDNLLCAILVASSLEKSRLVLGGEEQDVSTTKKCMGLLNAVLVNGQFVSNQDKVVSVDNILSNHGMVGTSQDVIVLSSQDLELDENVLLDLESRDVSLRVHATHKVNVVDTKQVHVSLNPTIYDRIKGKKPVTLGVMLDCTGSMGNEIEGCKQGALKLITTFRELAPVKAVNFMGYWDPVNVATDPPPKSTGYLDCIAAENMKVLQVFVNTELVCQGGGDAPEDIPQALEKWLADMKEAGLSADDGVHFLFFIADAGFRPNENARMMSALKKLKDLGVVMVMCELRHCQSLDAMVSLAEECFAGDGQYIQVYNVGHLELIATRVTESIRASLFSSSTVKSVTASVGSTIDAIRKLAAFQKDHETLKQTKDLTELVRDDVMEEKGKVFAKKKEYSLTSRDRLYLQLSRLPPACHEAVVACFGGDSLQKLAAVAIADRLVAEKISVSEVQKAGYPEPVVDLVRTLIAGHGIMRFEEE